MAGSSKKRKGTASGDFKRIKAKVGKKAVKPANVTDTSFKAASVSVKSQVVDVSSSANSSKLVSERGRSIQNLVTQLNHPAATVRTSAIRGLLNVVDSHSDFLKAHLSILVPAVAKCCVDENDDVRQLGLTVLKNLLATQEEQVLCPFLALLTAYVTSALNSLDRSTRLHGGRAVEILSTTLPLLMGSKAETLLPAFVGLLSDYNRQRRPDTTVNKKRKKTGDSNENGRFTILQSLVALLRTVPERKLDDTLETAADNKPELVFVPGGRTVNALLIAGRECRSVHPISSINEVATFAAGSLDGPSSEKGLDVAVATDIISKLRDIYIELSQRGGSEGSRGGLTLGATDMEELSLLNEAIRLFWNAYCYDMIVQQSSDTKQVEALRRVFTTLLSLMLESFPVWQLSSNADLLTKCALLNADMCATLMDIGGYLEADSKGLNWTKKVLDYLLPRLDSGSSVSIEDDTVVDVLSKLLLLRQTSTEFTLAEKTRCKVLEKMCKAFFVDELKPDGARLASSRRAALLIVELLKNEVFMIDSDSSLLSASLRLALRSLPFYLQAWRGDFLTESRVVLSALQDITRRIDLENQSTDDIHKFLRNGLTLIFEAPKRSKRQKRSHASLSPVFELYPEEMQRQALGLLVMVGAPSEATVNGLSYVCARCGTDDAEGAISTSIAGAVLYAVHSVRRSMSMQAYLSFIISSIGITNFQAKRKDKGNSDARRLDKKDAMSSVSETQTDVAGESHEHQPAGIQIDLDMLKASEASVLRAARSLILCGSAKVLPMIYPVLNDWLGVMSRVRFPGFTLDPSQMALQFRAAASTCAMLILDMNSLTNSVVLEDTKSQVSVSFEVPGFVAATCDMFAFCFSRGSSNHDSVDAFEYLMKPIVSLMKTDTKLVKSIFDQATHRICDEDTTVVVKEASAYIEALLWIVRNAELAVVLRKVSDALTNCCGLIESAAFTSNSIFERQASSLRTAMELLIGNVQK